MIAAKSKLCLWIFNKRLYEFAVKYRRTSFDGIKLHICLVFVRVEFYSNDNTVVPQHCLSFLDACIKAGTQPDFFAYPGEEHNMRGHASVHLHERITQYFEDYLK